MSDALKEARSLFEEFDKTKDVDAYIEAMHIVLDLKESSAGRNWVIAENMFTSYWEAGSNWIAQHMKPYHKEIETTKQKYIEQDHSPSVAYLLRFLEIMDPNTAPKVADLIGFQIDMMNGGKAPT